MFSAGESGPFPLIPPPLCSENAFSLSRDLRCQVRKIRMSPKQLIVLQPRPQHKLFEAALAKTGLYPLRDLGIEVLQVNLGKLCANAYGYSVLRECFRQEYRPVVESKRQYALVRQLRDQLNRRSAEHFGALPEYIANRFYVEFFSFLKNSLFDSRALDTQAASHDRHRLS